jgi:trans-2,3-dihydro-3-hydroxyanthranilate isomerase
MKVSIAWWNLDESAQTVDSLRAYLHDEGVAPWESVSGLCLKLWIADREHNRWGAIMLWQSNDADQQRLPPNKAAELIGYGPTQRVAFEVEATVEGIHSLSTLAGIGPAIDARNVS